MVIKSFIELNLEEPIPLTFFKSSIFLNLPFLFLYSIIFKAVDAPIPGKFVSSDCVAVFILIKPEFELLPEIIIFSPAEESGMLVSLSFEFGILIFCPSCNL